MIYTLEQPQRKTSQSSFEPDKPLIPTRATVCFSKQVETIEVEGYDDEWLQAAWLQRQDYHEIHLCRKISIKVFIRCSTNIRMRHAVDKSRFCFRGLELYKNAEYQAYQRELRQIAIQAVVVEANDQQLRGVTEPDRLRSVLEPASIKAARISLDQAFTDAMFAGTGAISSDVDSSSPLRQPQRMLSPKTQKQRLPPRGYDLRPRLFVHVPQSQAQTLFANRLSL